MTIFAKLGCLFGATAITLTATVSAHHSYAMFDINKKITLSGTVKEFQWTNPHSWIQLMVRDPLTGKDTEWSIEAASPAGLTRQGWKRSAVKPGDKAVVIMNPTRDGSLGGALVSVTINGVLIGTPPPGL